MFQYTKEVIINSKLADSDAYGSMLTLDKITAKPGLLRILRAGEYKVEGIKDRRIYKTPAVTGTFANVQMTITAGMFAEGPGIYRFSIFVDMKNKFLGEYANASWYLFGKPLQVEVDITDVADTAGNAAKIAAALNLAIPYNNKWARVTVAGDVVTVKFTDAYISVHGAMLEYYKPTACDSCVGEYIRQPFAPVITQNREPFGTGAWIQENLRFPAYPNLRYSALYADEYPVIGELYTEYSFAYDVEAIGYYGISAVNQKVEKVTRHVYYVLNSLVDWFEGKIEDAFGDNVIVENNTVIINGANTVANDGIAVRLIPDTYPIVDNAQYTFTVSGGTATEGTDFELTTGGGVLTVLPAATPGDTIEVTATLTNPPSGVTYTPAVKTITIIQG